MSMRINKLLANAGLGSRRETEQLISSRQVKINGIIAELADVVEEEDVVTVNGGELPVADIIRQYEAEQKQLLYEKAAGVRIGGADFYVDEDEDELIRGSKRARGTAFRKNPVGRKSSEPAKFRKYDQDEAPGKPYFGKNKGGHRTAKYDSKRPEQSHKSERMDTFSDEDFYEAPATEKRSYSNRPTDRPHFHRDDRDNTSYKPRRDRDSFGSSERPRHNFSHRNDRNSTDSNNRSFGENHRSNYPNRGESHYSSRPHRDNERSNYEDRDRKERYQTSNQGRNRRYDERRGDRDYRSHRRNSAEEED